MTTKISLNNLQSSVATAISSGGGGVKITGITYPNSATAGNTAGAEIITVTGSGFNSGATVYVDSNICNTTYVSSSSLTFVSPSKNIGSYHIFVYNTDGSSGVKPNGITFSSVPVWVTSSGAQTNAILNASYNQNVSATGDGTITYSITSGSLPTGLSLNSSNGAITGTSTVEGTSNFTITATDSQNQTTSRSFIIETTNIVIVDYLAIAGGGSGGTGYYGGGGGAGGYVEATSITFTRGTVYTITLGAGGVGTTVQTNKGGNGSNTTISGSGFTTVTAIGGGGGGSRNNDTANGNATGANGGSGGGTAFPPTSVGGRGVYPGSAYLSQTRQGYDGAPAPVYGTDYGSGGGGAGAAGQYLSVNGTTNGGIGIQSSITGSAVYYGGGGGGGIGSGAGGTGGGGNKNTAGTTNTGGGGGGASDNNGQGGNGGSGVVILKINGSAGNVSITGTPPDTIVGSGYTVYKFTSSGSITFN
jgi:hypothetical protein